MPNDAQPQSQPPGWWAPYAREFPGWHVWQGVGATGLYARLPRSSPAIVVSARVPAELATQIRAWYIKRGAAVNAPKGIDGKPRAIDQWAEAGRADAMHEVLAVVLAARSAARDPWEITEDVIAYASGTYALAGQRCVPGDWAQR